MFMFLEDAGTLEGQGIVNAPSMANGVIHDNKQIGKGDKLRTGQIATAYRNVTMHLAVQ
jgi:hypothetical protein